MPSPGIPEEGKRGAKAGFYLLIAVLALAAAAKVILYDTLDPDLFWHLKVADQLAALPFPHPIVDQLSFASIKSAWTPYSWLAELMQKDVWDTGGYRAAVAAQAALAAGIVAILALIAIETTRACFGRPRYLAAAVATFAAEFLSLPYLSFRPVTFAVLLLAGIAWLLQRDRRMNHQSKPVWLVPPLTALLANIHLYVVFAPAAVAALLLGAWRKKQNIRRNATLFLATTVASLMTPMLPGVIASAYRYQYQDTMVASTTIAEMQPFWHGPLGYASAAVALGVIFLALLNRRRLSTAQWIALIVCIALLARMGRMATIFAIFAAPTLAVTLPKLRDAALARRSMLCIVATFAILECVRIVAAFPSSEMSLSQWLNRMGPEAGGYPTAAAEFVQDRIPPRTHRIICEFTWGGYLEWRLNQNDADHWQVLMDGRTQLFTDNFWKSLYLGTPAQRRAYLSHIEADAAVLPTRNSSFRDDLISLGWKTAHSDPWAQVLIPPR